MAFGRLAPAITDNFLARHATFAGRDASVSSVTKVTVHTVNNPLSFCLGER